MFGVLHWGEEDNPNWELGISSISARMALFHFFQHLNLVEFKLLSSLLPIVEYFNHLVIVPGRGHLTSNA